jgi:AraC-like DNA-binding protein
MQYLARWRMQMAANLLTEGRQPIGRIAEAVGYDSEAGFSRAFRRMVGTPPASWRRLAADPPEHSETRPMRASAATTPRG